MALLTVQWTSDVMLKNVTMNVLLPNDIKPGEKLPVLYLLHGYWGDYSDWIRLSALERHWGGMRLAIVMPSGDNSYYTNLHGGLAYLTHIAEEVPAFVERTFPVSSKREDHFIAGLSMGGYGALKIALMYPERFAKVASLSGALDVTQTVLRAQALRSHVSAETLFGTTLVEGTQYDLKTLVKQVQASEQPMPEIYLTCGKDDFLLDDTVNFGAFLTKRNIPHLYQIDQGVHDWVYWDTHIQPILQWLLNDRHLS